MNVSFERLDDGAGLRVNDPIEHRQYELLTSDPVDPQPAGDDRFAFPIDAGVSVRTDGVRLPQVVATFVRDASGAVVAEAEHNAHHDLPEGEYGIELCGPIKVYLRVEGPLTVTSDAGEMRFEFAPDTELYVGARSHHKNPAATITTTNDPRDVMTAVSYLGSALKTTSPERSYPTLRGHPPTIELGEELSVPEGLEAPDTGVRIELPPDYESVFVAAPLSYYLGAEVVPGSTPQIVTDTGFVHSLEGPRGFEREVERVLKQTFFLDCLTRTEGFYDVDLHERRAVEDRVDLDFADLYDRSLAEQLEAYLAVPFEALEDHLPEWKLTTHVAPTAESIEMLPFVVNDLAVVRTPRATAVSRSEAQNAAVEEFMRDGAFTRSASASGSADAVAASSCTPSLVQPEETDSLEQAWVGEDAPVGASKATVTAFRNKLARSATDGDIDITVVCNDEAMLEEHEDAAEVYGSRQELPFDVTHYQDLTTDRLRFVLESDVDFLHYIGHIDDAGFQCADGFLDVGTLNTVGVDAFFLNACRSYDQGMKLIERGAIGGVVTLDDVLDSGAIRVGTTMSRLLNQGFPLRAALEIAKNRSIVGGQYSVLGDGNMAVVQSESGASVLGVLKKRENDYELSLQMYPAGDRDMGSMIVPYVRGNGEYYLNSGKIGPFSVDLEELNEFLSLENIPLQVNNDLVWSREFDVGKL